MPAESSNLARAIAREAYIYAYPMLVGYGFFYAQLAGARATETQSVNRLTHFRRLGSPDYNNTIPWINTDTPYSAAWLDLRAQPLVLSVPQFEAHRFQNIQLNDWYTHNIANRGTRAPGNGAARYLIAGPDWDGAQALPDGVDELIRAETRIVKLVIRILLEGPDDYPAIHALQDQYRLQTLSDYLGAEPPPDAPDIAFPAPAVKGFLELPSSAFIACFNFLLRLCAPHPSERGLFERFAEIGIAPGAPFDPQAIAPDLLRAIDAGASDGQAHIMDRLNDLCPAASGWEYPLNLRGDRAAMARSPDSYLRRAVAARYAIWGPSKEEVVYMTCAIDADGEQLDGGKHDYVIDLPEPLPARGYWSLTVYDAATRLLVRHPSGRYKLGDRDAGMARGPGGALRLHLRQSAPEQGPGADAPPANWLPVPAQPFQLVARLYWPRASLLDGSYLPPAIKKSTAPRAI